MIGHEDARKRMIGLSLSGTLPGSDPACGGGRADAAVDEVGDRGDGDDDSDHTSPLFRLSLDVDARIAAQVLVRILAFEIRFAGIHVAFVTVVPVVLGSIFTHLAPRRVDGFRRVVSDASSVNVHNKVNHRRQRGNDRRLTEGW